jgi:starvation-inducible outer membrane lipoprotein
MAMHCWSFLIAALLLAGCAAIPQQHNVQDVHICAADDCDTTGQKYSAAQLFAG